MARLQAKVRRQQQLGVGRHAGRAQLAQGGGQAYLGIPLCQVGQHAVGTVLQVELHQQAHGDLQAMQCRGHAIDLGQPARQRMGDGQAAAFETETAHEDHRFHRAFE
ncbi:hypothetical protein D3C85_1561340 [compost metagenome]